MIGVYELSCLFILLVSLWVVIWIYRRQLILENPAKAFLSPLTYFTLLWWLAYPLHAFLLQWGLVDTQQKAHFSESDLVLAVLLSGVLMGVIVFGVERCRFLCRAHRETGYSIANYSRSTVAIAITISAALWFLLQTVFQNLEWNPFIGNTQNMMRLGAGPFFLMSVMILYALLVAVPLLVFPWWRVTGWQVWVFAALFLIGLILTIILMVSLSSRRMVFVVGFAIFVAVMMKWKKPSLAVAVIVISATVFAAPVMQVMRYIGNPGFAVDKKHVNVCNMVNGLQKSIIISESGGGVKNRGWLADRIIEYECTKDGYILYYGLQTIGTTYGLADHLATYIRKSALSDFLLGIDQGKSWVFNLGLSYVPRAFWRDKPIQYGSIAIQKWLYPEMFEKQAITMTLPPGFVVDFLFGFGVIGAILISYYFGIFLGVIRVLLWSKGCGSAAMFALSLCVMAYMFNIVRGGSGAVVSIYPILVMMLVTYGMDLFNNFGVLSKVNRSQ